MATSQVKDLKGKRFGRLTVLGFDEESTLLDKQKGKQEKIKKGKTFWKCICDCGNMISVRGSGLTTGNTKSCGCLSRQISSSIGKNNKKQNIYEELGDCYRGWDIKHENSFIIDKIDYEIVSKHCWCLNTKGYWYTNDYSQTKKYILLHNLILQQTNYGYIPSRLLVSDHVDRNKNNNKRNNLELKTQFYNTRNKTTRKDNTSGKQGVSWHSRTQKWLARIADEKGVRHSKSFLTFEDAVKQRLAWEKEFRYIGE